MKTASTELTNAIRNNYFIDSRHRLTAEWNMNRYVGANVTVNQDNDYLGAFPISSVINPERPSKSGIVKASTDNGILYAPGETTDVRYYPVSVDDYYKYWISKPATSISASGGGYQFNVDPVITINYDQTKTNKISLLIENNFNNIIKSDVYVKLSATGTYTLIASDIAFDSNGRLNLYYQGSNWSSTVGTYLDKTVDIYGVQFVVHSVSKSQQPVAIIEISPRLVKDLTQYVINFQVDEEISDTSFISPIGAASSNQAKVTLSNTDGIFNTTKITSPYFNILDRNVLMTGEMAVLVGSSYQYVTMFTMLTQSWSGQSTEEVSVDLEDDSSRMKIVNPPRMLLENLPIGEIISILCDSMGFTNYKYTNSDLDVSQKINYYFNEENKNLWETISELSQGTQAVVYFDHFNELQIKSRNAFLNSSRTSTWNVLYEKTGQSLPDLIEYSEEYQMEANSVDVIYTPTKPSDFNNGQPKMEVVWEPKDTLVLRASSLQQDMNVNDVLVFVTSEKAATWPYEGMVSIDSEIIKFRGKAYRYWTSSTYSKITKIYSLEEKEKLDALTPDALTYRNAFTGELSVTQRGVNNSPISKHSKGTSEIWRGYITEDLRDAPYDWQGGISVNNSLMTLTTNYTFREQNNYCARAPSSMNPAPGNKVHYGTRIRFREGYSPNNLGEAGIFIASNPSTFVGYWISLRLTEAVEATNRFRNEVAIWGRLGDYNTTTFVHNPLEIRRGVWYDVDVEFEITSTHDHVISVFINGQIIASKRLAGNDRIITGGGHHGIQVGNFSSVDFEYYYATLGDASYAPDTSTLYDAIRGGFSNGVVQSNWYQTAFYDDLGGLSGTKSFRGVIFFDDFGSIVHEVREFDVTYEQPVLYSKPYVTNERVVIPAFYGDPYGAHFVMINAAREDAIVKGDDTITYGAENSVTQSAFIYGRQIYQEEEQLINVFSQANINRRGLQKTQFNNKFLQNKETSQDLGNWVVRQWGSTSKTATVEIFGNPLIQVGDIITVTYVPKDIYNKKFYVNRVANSYERGLTTNLSLRSVSDDALISMNSYNTGSASSHSVYITD